MSPLRVALLLPSLAACGLAVGTSPAAPAAASPAALPGWRLVWADEFDRPGAPDPAKWNYEVGFVRNNELQYYTQDRRANVRVEEGCLVLELRKEKYPNAQYKPDRPPAPRRRHVPEADYTSGSVTTDGLVGWQYGRVEVRAKLPAGRGFWPAIWMLGTNKAQVGWPRCGEIDIMENVGFLPEVIHGTVHTGAYNHRAQKARGDKITVARPDQDFHVYAMEWDAEQLTIAVDGRTYFAFRNEKSGPEAWPFDQKMYLILNVAFGGGWGGQQGIDETIQSGRMLVDYVRVYQR